MNKTNNSLVNSLFKCMYNSLSIFCSFILIWSTCDLADGDIVYSSFLFSCLKEKLTLIVSGIGGTAEIIFCIIKIHLGRKLESAAVLADGNSYRLMYLAMRPLPTFDIV